MLTRVDTFRERLVQLGRDELLALLKEQDPELLQQVRRIEWVFKNKLTHLTWTNGTPVVDRPVTDEELALLIDPPFESDPELTRLGLNTDQQRQAFIAADPVLWARHFLEAKPRAYQVLMLRHPNKRKVLRAGRRLGKSWTLAVLMLHWAYTHNHARILVLTPMKSQAEVIFKELHKQTQVNPVVATSVTRAVTSPHPVFEFANGSIIRFFSTGLKSGGKSDVARGQEAHLIILDELDYMGPDDLDAILAMLQRTDDTQEDKVLVGASTPSGAQNRFFQWCQNPRFKEYWFPSYVNPFFTKEIEDEFREQYSDMVYRHEIEADWGEDTEGVYPRRWVELACRTYDWDYVPELTSARSFYVIGVDWDKYGAGTNIVVLEVCQEDYEDERFRSKSRVAWREEIPKDQFTLTKGVQRVIELNELFNPRHIYVDRGNGEVQVELLRKHGMDNPTTGLVQKVQGVSFSENIIVFDPATKQEIKKEIKPYMVDNLRLFLEREQLYMPSSDELIFRQLIGYVVARTGLTGRPVFQEGEAGDHAHDGLLLACLAVTQNYGELTKLKLARRARSVSNEHFMPTFTLSDDETVRERQEEQLEKIYGSTTAAPVQIRRAMAGRRASLGRSIKRSNF